MKGGFVMHRSWFALLLAAALLTIPVAAKAGSIEQADMFAAEGQKLFAAGEYKLALEKYTQAYTTYPQSKSVFGIASCYEALGNLPRALDAYETFTQYEQTDEVLSRIESETRKLKEKLSQDYGEVFIFSSPGGAQIIIDEISKQNVYQTPTRRWLKDGDHVIFFKKEGAVPREIKLSVKRGEHLYVYAGLKATN
jgi:tetratricopeptide (TPR) repeat protein